jgi:GTP-binding protein EngB required for normal cell division
MLDEVTYELRKRDTYSLEETESRNILMVGRTRSGKSTAVNVIKDLCYAPKDMSIFSDTENPKFQSFALLNKADGVKLTLNMIDTPGVFEVKADEAKVRTNEMILKVISQCSQSEITKLHSVCIFASFETGVNIEDIEAIKMFNTIFRGANILLVITRSEDKPIKWKDSMKDQLLKHPGLKDILKNDQIYFMGCFDPNTSPLTDKSQIINCYKQVNLMRTTLLQRVFACDKPMQIRGLAIVQNKIQKFKQLVELYEIQISEIDKLQDKTTGAAQIIIHEIDTTQSEMLKCLDIIDQCDDEVRKAEKLAREFRIKHKDDVDLVTKCTHIFKIRVSEK